MRIAFFEDAAADGFSPVALVRPVFELFCGQFSLRERLLRRFDVTQWGAFLRPVLADVYREEHPEAHVNAGEWLQDGPTLFINGRWLPSLEALAQLDAEQVGLLDDDIVYLTLQPDEASKLRGVEPCEIVEALTGFARSRQTAAAGGFLARYPWDLVHHNAEQLTADFRLRQYPRTAIDCHPQVAVLGEPDNVYIDSQATIDPFVVLDARSGPISLEAGVHVQPFSRIAGPCHIGYESHVVRGNIHEGTTIGPVCRVGGEVEESILHGYVNKYHAGFLGHAYVCPWVNLGALTTNSDLKNDYSTVRVPVGGLPVETGSKKVGCFIGDHTKTALGSLFNTGSSIGVMCMVLPAGELLPKHVPSFCRIWYGVPDDRLDLDAALQTARTAMARRHVELSPAQEQVLRHLYNQTREERAAAISRFAEKRAARSTLAAGCVDRPQPSVQ